MYRYGPYRMGIGVCMGIGIGVCIGIQKNRKMCSWVQSYK